MAFFRRDAQVSSNGGGGLAALDSNSTHGQGLILSAYLAGTWLLLAAFDTVLVLAVSGTAFAEVRLPLAARIALVATELTALAGLVVLVFGPVGIWSLRWLSVYGRNRLASVIGLAPAMLITWVMLFLLGVSWGMFRTTAQFLDLEALRLWAVNPEQMVQHVIQTELMRLVMTLVVVTGISILLFVMLSWFRVAEHRGLLRRMTFLVALGLLLCCGVALGGYWRFAGDLEPVRNPGTRSITLRSEVFRVAREDRSGPVTHSIAAARRRTWMVREVKKTTELRIIRHRQISMDEYLENMGLKRSDPPNVIVILLESLRADQLEVYGGSRPVMPALDRFALAGRVFSKAYCQANNSFAGDPCALSGQYPVRERGMHIYPVDPLYPRVLLWDVLKPLGYRTAIISSQNEGWGRMIDFFDTGNLDTIFHAETAPESSYVESSDSAFAAWIKKTKMAGKLDDRLTVDVAIQWIDEAQERPFFFYLNLQSSHLPYKVPKEFERPFGPATIDFNLAFGSYPLDKSEIVRDLYADSLRYMDDQLGRLFEHLEDSGLMEHTIIVVSGDSGEAFYEHGFSAHANKIYNEVMLVPLIIRAPGLSPGMSVVPAQHVDIPSTVLGLLGLPPHPSFQGVDLLQSPPPPVDRAIYLAVQLPGAQQFGIVRGDYKLIFDVLEQRNLLFDLSRDPGEIRDLSNSMVELTQVLQSRLHTWYELQVGYYEDHQRMIREYPPVIAD